MFFARSRGQGAFWPKWPCGIFDHSITIRRASPVMHKWVARNARERNGIYADVFQSSPLVDDKPSSCLSTRGEGHHGKHIKAYFWRCNRRREHRNSGIVGTEGQAGLCLSEWICDTKQPTKRDLQFSPAAARK
jgi:hypothetical protein